jgi:hypothetical protein
MNEIIKDVLEERAEHARAPHVDAAQLIRAARRRRTARRVGVVAVAAAVASIVAVAPTIVDRLPGQDDAANPAPGLDLPWADADYLYYGDDRIPRPDGYLGIATLDDRLRYSTSEEPSPPETPYRSGSLYEWRPGEGSDPTLIVDDAIESPLVEGDLAAWVEADGPDQLRLHFMVGDTEYPPLSLPATKNGLRIGALDAGESSTVIYTYRGSLWSWDGSGNPTRLDIDANDFIDRAAGVTVVTDGWADDGTWIMRFLDSTGGQIGRASGVWPEPDGRLDDSGSRFLSRTGVASARPAVLDVTTGEITPLDIGRSMLAMQMAWELDGDVTVAVRPKAQNEAPVDLVTCSPANGDCVVIAEDIGDFSDVILAGETYAGM